MERKFEFRGWLVIARLSLPYIGEGKVGHVKVSDDVINLDLVVVNPDGNEFEYHHELWAGYFPKPDDFLKKIRVEAVPGYSAASAVEGWENAIHIWLYNASMYVWPDGSTVWED